MNLIISKIGLPATLEQLAEEAAELSQAALKVARIIRRENPTPVGYCQAVDNLKEEAADVPIFTEQWWGLMEPDITRPPSVTTLKILETGQTF